MARLADEGSSQSGFALIEVIASALIVAVISVGTLTGFGTAGRAVADERQRGQATLLAAQDEERLRAMNVTELAAYETQTNVLNEQGTKYAVGEKGTKYTVESKAQFVSVKEKEKYTCETSEGTADYIQTTSTVTWPALTTKKGKREGVSQASIVPVPTSDSVLVNVRNQINQPVEGATVKVKGKTSGAISEQTTPASGCVIFGAMSDSQVTIVVSKPTWVNEKLEEESSQEVQLSTTSLVNKTFVIASPGLINVEFTSAATGAAVQGDTYHVSHTTAPEKVIGVAGTYVSPLLSSKVFPYGTPLPPPEDKSVYTIYAGECSQTNPELLGRGLKAGEVQVNPGTTSTEKLPLPAINLVVDEGAIADSKAEAKLTDACGTARMMKTTGSGGLEHPYQPYGKTTLCLTQLVGTTRYKYSTEFTIESTAGYPSSGGPLTVNLTASGNKSSSGC